MHGLNLLGFWFDHDITVDKNGTNDGEGEEPMSEYVDGNSPDWMEGWQQIQCLFGGKTKNGSTFGDDNECLLVQEVGINVTDRSTGKLLRKFTIPSW